MRKAVFAAAMLCALRPAAADSLAVTVTGEDGKPAPDAVVELVPAAQTLASHVPAETSIDQRQEMFTTLVNVVRKGGRVVFLNHDTTMHQVYSFSAIRQFQFEIRQGQHSAPVVFDKPGVAAVGCNIHDRMITYVYVSDAPFAAVSGAGGPVKFDDVPPGVYDVRIWHPRLRDAPAAHRITVKGDVADSIPLHLAAPPRHAMHMGSY